MKRILLILTLTAIIFSSQNTQAQSLRDRVKNKIFKEPVEVKAKDDSTTVIEIDDPTESSSARFSNEAMMGALGLTDNVPHEEVYNFDAYIQMEISIYKKNGKLDEQMLYDSYLHKEAADYAMEFREKDYKSTVVFDTKNQAMLVLSESGAEKTGFATSVDPDAMADLVEEYAEEEEVDMDSYKPVKTGKTKEILGYKCEEYLVEEEDSEIHMWVSDQLGEEIRKEWMANQQTFGAMFVHAYALNGMVLEYDLIEKNGAKTIMEVKKIDMNHSHEVDTRDYTIMSMRKKAKDE
jgi:hypothetical protein